MEMEVCVWVGLGRKAGGWWMMGVLVVVGDDVGVGWVGE